MKINIAIIPLLAALLPIVSINVSYVIAAGLDHVPTCFVYVEGCTSISSTGRAAPESLWFRATVIPSAVLMILTWRLVGGWLRCLEGERYRGSRGIQSLGIIAGLFLVVYTVALGFVGPEYHLQRRIGVILFFGCTFLAQVMLTNRLWKLAIATDAVYPMTLARYKLILSGLLLALGLGSIPVSYFIDSNVSDNIIEWNFSILMIIYFVFIYLGWRATGFSASLAVEKQEAK
jgi:hypothetical protein